MTPAAPHPTSMAEELAPVGEALLHSAEVEAERIRARAASERDQRLRTAREEAGRIRARAERDGQTAATELAAADLAAAGRAARRTVLAARRRAYDELRREVHARLSAWIADPVVEAVLRRRIAETLGPRSAIKAVPDGLTGVRGDHRVDVSVDGLTDEALRRLGTAAEELWRS